MTAPNIYDFRQLTLSDIPLLTEWQSNPHVAEWWDAEDPYDESDLRDARVSRFIVSHKDRPFAFMQDYTVHGWPDHHFFDLPQGARGIDQYVGDPEMIGRGHGTAFIRQRMAQLFSQGAPAIGTDPHPDNARAIAVYSKLGFAPVRPAEETRWGPILPMVAWNTSAAS
ncbi:GNAT family N-acetyltransferase [uncultured Litoreibacter sp.]|uniref:GNAT family N-acetyltransferase n=1 Tax=uncultured Litoreibacter sp. TaxID=1392394 RepID=UPI0026310CF9|nr:GNAT family N-acetyltransferase [uncultured Litoreibacter sp.]